MYSSDHSCIVFCPYFDFYDISVYSISYDYLKEDLNQAVLSLKDILKAKNITSFNKVKFAVCCKGEFKETPLYKVIEELNFEKINSIARFNAHGKEYDESILEFVPEEFRKVEYAQVEDAQRILDLFLDNFDPAGDSLPELSDIIENIKKKQVVCVKDAAKNNQVICFHYFEVINNIFYGLYDCTDKEYRKDFVYYSILYWNTEQTKHNNVKYARSYGWRDVTKTRLNKFGKDLNQTADGVLFHNYKYPLI